ncbi:MAG: PAS domain S-box protein [Methylococcaceae bacterium]
MITENIFIKESTSLNTHSDAIRKQAEKLISHSNADISQMSTEDIQNLLFDLQTHQIELKMQNEELNRAQLELTASRDNYAQLYDSLPVGYLALTDTGLIEKANAAAATLLGCAKKQLINQNLTRFIHPSDQDNYYLFMRRLLADNIDQTLELKFNHVRDASTHLECQYQPDCHDINHSLRPCDSSNLLTAECSAHIAINDDHELRIFMIISDITERKQAQETIVCLNERLEDKILRQTSELTEANQNLIKTIEDLRLSKHQLFEREAKLNSIFNASVEGIITINTSDIIVSTNAAVETIFGYQQEELIGRSINKLLAVSPKGNQLRTVKFIRKISEIDGLHKNGSVVPLDLSVAEFSLDNAQYFTHIVRDVSFRKHQEQQDKEHLDELAHVTRLGLMGEMASGIAHEVNQPLSAISSYTQASLNLIKTEHPDLVKLTEIISKTQQQALRAGRIIHRMRAFVKSHSKHRSTVDINEIIHDAVGLCNAELKQNNIKLLFELEENLPPLYVDQIQIEQVLINLLRNSAEALQNHPITQQPLITIQSHLVLDNSIQVRVKDNGQGLDEDQQQKILTPFYTTKADGMGMGLSISRSLIESHEGELHFNSEPGKGTTFYFTLPLRRQSDEG